VATPSWRRFTAAAAAPDADAAPVNGPGGGLLTLALKPTTTPKSRAPLLDGGAGSGLLHWAVLPRPVPLRRMPDRAPHGAAAGNRVSANAVGRRSSFLWGRVFFAPCSLLRPRGDDDAGPAAGRARRPGMKISRQYAPPNVPACLPQEGRKRRTWHRCLRRRPGSLTRSTVAVAAPDAEADDHPKIQSAPLRRGCGVRPSSPGSSPETGAAAKNA
jgi:hypothetical protein